MKFFLDTANLDQIREAASLGILDGVTTNPSLMANEGITGEAAILHHYEAICQLVNGDVSAEVLSTAYDGMVREGHQLSALHENIVVKIPMTMDGIRAIARFSEKGIKTNCTLVFSSAQAILAAKAGATYLSPFLGRLDDVGSDGIRLLREITDLYRTRGWKTQVLAASIRGPMHVVESAKAGADAVTCPLKTMKELFTHPLTDAGLGIFATAAKAMG